MQGFSVAPERVLPCLCRQDIKRSANATAPPVAFAVPEAFYGSGRGLESFLVSWGRARGKRASTRSPAPSNGAPLGALPPAPRASRYALRGPTTQKGGHLAAPLRALFAVESRPP